MALSLLVLLVPIAIMVAGYRFLGGESPTPVDTARAFADARAAHMFAVAEPTGLPSGWQPASAAFVRSADGGTLRVGYRGPNGAILQLVESSRPAGDLLAAELGAGARLDGSAVIAGRDWQKYLTGRGELAVVLPAPDRTIVIVGRAADEELLALARSVG